MRKSLATRGYIARDALPEDVLVPPVLGARRPGILRCVPVAGQGRRTPRARRGERAVRRLVGWVHGRRRSGKPGVASEPDVTADPTPIRISKRTRTALILAMLAVLGLVI
jgi:hypothetical protein